MAEPIENSGTGLDLAELVDLELQLRSDRGEDPAQLRRRDAAIGREICGETGDAVSLSRAEVLRGWLQALRPEVASTPGRKLAAAYRLGSFCFVALGFLSGASAAAALLRYDGGDPVNVVSYLAVLVGLQVLLATTAVVSMLPQLLRRRVSPLGPLHAALREFGVRRAGVEAAAAEIGKRAGADTGALQAWGAIYGECERWRLLAITQRAAVAFNVGALIASFYRVAVTALAFSWSTTLDLDAATVHGATTLISLPWFWVSDAVPSLSLVEASHYFPGGQYDPAMLGDWWPFLLASLLTYGLLPRLILWIFAERRSHALRVDLPLDHGDARLAYQRLTSGWTSDDDPDSAHGGADGASVRVLSGMPDECRAVVWADAPLSEQAAVELVRKRTGCARVTMVDSHAASAQSETVEAEAVVILAEAWEAPTRALGRLLEGLRAQAKDRTSLVVLLLDADADSAMVWRRYLAELGDPYLFVDDGLGGTAE